MPGTSLLQTDIVRMVLSLTKTLLAPLPRSDGSATYSHAGYSIACGINGPIDVQRKDELPEQATIDVVVRPAYGVGGKIHNITWL